MSDDRALVLFLIGVLGYRAIDLATFKAKLEQALGRARRAIAVFPIGPTPRQFRPAYRIYTKNLKPREFYTLTIWFKGANFLAREFAYFMLYACTLVLLLLGLVLIATHANRAPEVGRAILAVTTLAVSTMISVVTQLLEWFRLQLEKV